MISMRIFLLHFETNISLTLTLSRYAVMAWFLSVNESCPLTLVSICLECSRIFTKLRELIRDEFNTLWKTQVSSFPKADTYREFKNVKYESYLSDINYRTYRVPFTKI